jgi:pre-mRNA-splicing factor 38A
MFVHSPSYFPGRYLRALAAIYIRMTFRAVDVYEILEPLLKDYRKLRYRDQGKHTCHIHMSRLLQPYLAGYYLTYIDEFVDQLLNDERVCDIILPRLPKRAVLEENGELAQRQSLLLDAMEGKEEGTRSRSRSNSRGSGRSSRTGTSYRSRSPSEERGEDESRQGSRSPSISRSASPVRSDGRFRSRSRSVSPDRV